MNVSFFSDLLSTISERGRGLIGLARGDEHGRASVADLVKLSHELISRRGEASGVALARIILDRYSSLPQKDRFAFLAEAAGEFGSDEEAIERAIDSYRKTPSRAAAHALHGAAEPKSQELIRRLNLANGGTLSLVRMREDLIDLFQTLRTERSDAAVAVESLDQDFAHLFSSWFNRGFLVLRRVDWTTPAHILEKIIRYEAVHEISDWDDLRRRIAPADRRCFAFFHPALVDEPLIFVEVALTTEIPGAIAPILTKERDPVPLKAATTAVFYSISNCQRGLSGVSFGNFLIKQVVEDLCREIPNLKSFVTLSPVPGFAGWLAREMRSPEPTGIVPEDRELLQLAEEPDWFAEPATAEAVRKPLLSAAAYYFLRAKTATGRPVDPVARFHLGNGARLERLNFLGDTSPKGLKQSLGLMVNYLYDLDTIEKHHEAYANLGVVTASSAAQKALRREAPSRAVPAAE
jgi:malonyl-CoA decarboxylase